MYIEKGRDGIPDKLYMTANDVDISKYVLYFKSNDFGSDQLNYLYFDSECSRPVSNKELQDLFIKGSVLIESKNVTFYKRDWVSPLTCWDTAWDLGNDERVASEKYVAGAGYVGDASIHAVLYHSQTNPPLLADLSIHDSDDDLAPAFDPHVFTYDLIATSDRAAIWVDVGDDLNYPHTIVISATFDGVAVDVDEIREILVWTKGQHVLVFTLQIENGVLTSEYTINIDASNIPDPPLLSALTIGSLTLSPSFDSGVVAYTAATTDTSNILTFTTVPNDAIVTVKLGDTVIDDISQGIEWANGENILTITVTDGEVFTEYVVTVTASIPTIPPMPTLSALTIGSLTLSPSFDSGVVAYTAATTDTSNILTFTTVPADAPVVVKLDDEPITTYSEGIVWTEGENILTITVGEDPAAVTYTVTVTVTAS